MVASGHWNSTDVRRFQCYLATLEFHCNTTPNPVNVIDCLGFLPTTYLPPTARAQGYGRGEETGEVDGCCRLAKMREAMRHNASPLDYLISMASEVRPCSFEAPVFLPHCRRHNGHWQHKNRYDIIAQTVNLVANLECVFADSNSKLLDWNETKDFFRFTRGRWVVDEAKQVRLRTHSFDMNQLAREAARCLNSRCIHIEKLPDGLYNKAYLFRMNDGREVVGKVTNPSTGLPHYSTASEVATMDFVCFILGQVKRCRV